MTSESPIVGRNHPNSTFISLLQHSAVCLLAERYSAGLQFGHLKGRVVIDVANYAFLVDADDSAVARAVGIKEPILLGDGPVRVEVTQEREVDSALLLEGF